jgi:hypothetical protein
MGVNEVRDYWRLRQENTQFRKMIADRDLEIEAMKEVIRKTVAPPARRNCGGSLWSCRCRSGVAANWSGCLARPISAVW